MHRVMVQARTLWEAVGLAIVEFRKQGIANPGLMQVTVAKRITYVAQPEKFWNWLRREHEGRPQEAEIRNKLRDMLGVPLTRAEKRDRQQR